MNVLKSRMARKESAALALCLILGAVLFFYNADNYYLWGDEGVTAFYGKNTLRYGLPYGFDGRNLLEFGNGIYLNRNFLPLLDPWAQYYVSAASQALFGMTSFGARALFIVFGLLAVFAQYLFVRRYFGDARLALINTVLMLTSVTYILFSRQSRYYALGMFLTPVICWLYARSGYRPVHLVLAAVLCTVFFFTNSLIGMVVLAAVALSFFVFDDQKKSLVFFLPPVPVVILSAGSFLLWLTSYGMPANPNFLKNIHPSDFSRIIWLYFKDYNETQLLPLGMLLILILQWVAAGDLRGRRGLGLERIRKEWSVLAIIVLATIGISVLSPQQSGAPHSDIRYAAPLFPMLLLVQAFAIDRLFAWKKGAAAALLAVAIATNLMTFMPFRSYLYEFARENIQPFDNSVKVAVKFLEKRVQKDDIVLVNPNHMLGSMEYYLADTALFCNVIGEDNKNLLAAGVRLPGYVYEGKTTPRWVVLFGEGVDMQHTAGHLNRLNLSRYRSYSFPILGMDVSRPELFWRSFGPIKKYDRRQGLFILERIEQIPGS